MKMWCAGIVLAIWSVASGAAPAPKTMKDLTFLTRADCVNTPDMVNNLDDALKGARVAERLPVHRHRQAAD